MKSLIEYIISESKELSDNEYKNIVNEAIYEYFEGDMDKVIKELNKYDFDMDIILNSINRGKLPESAKLIGAIHSYLEDYFHRDVDEYYEHIINNLDKYLEY